MDFHHFRNLFSKNNTATFVYELLLSEIALIELSLCLFWALEITNVLTTSFRFHFNFPFKDLHYLLIFAIMLVCASDYHSSNPISG